MDSHQSGVCGRRPNSKEYSPQTRCLQSDVHRNQRCNDEHSASRPEDCPTDVIPSRSGFRPTSMRSISDVLTESEIQQRVRQFAKNIETESPFNSYQRHRQQPLEFYCRRFNKRLRKVNQWLVIKKRIQKSKLRQEQNSSSSGPGSLASTSTLPADPDESSCLTSPRDTRINSHAGQPPHSVWISLDSDDNAYSSNTDHISHTGTQEGSVNRHPVTIHMDSDDDSISSNTDNISHTDTQECSVNRHPVTIHMDSDDDTYSSNTDQISHTGTQEGSVNCQPISIHIDSEDEANGNAHGEPDHSGVQDKFLVILDSDEELSSKEIQITSRNNSSKELIIYVDSDDNDLSDTIEKNRKSTPSSDSDVIEVPHISDSEDEPKRIQEKGKPLVPDVQIEIEKGTGITQRSSNRKVSRLQEDTAGSTGQREPKQTVLKITAKPKKLKKRKSHLLKRSCKASSLKLSKNIKC
ncbi:hypothetical protein LOTGIDRAFT_174584 [Lottia gigantea]|uniref:Uncharacterized protein n=1 Tax=Lottia gigantea TaxID=225164 RepID=V4AQP5_LOTGI|nr:hypothetical protein LOTGIDRAFT_174584 [Lottia gigantea]ESO97150.1 hypothetical protein LOTGIDRAFT_174584 [Lottia gigantea]